MYHLLLTLLQGYSVIKCPIIKYFYTTYPISVIFNSNLIKS